MRKNRKLVRITFALAVIAALATIGVGAASARQASTTVTGAGSTFIAPLVAKWATVTSSKIGVSLNYSAVGSGAGILAITNRTADFGASDAPLSPAQFTACGTGGGHSSNCLQIPWILAGTAIDYHLNGVAKTLKLSGAVIAGIYLGQITYWDDGKIKSLNHGVSIPHTKIAVFHRSDGSGTTYNFTDYLSAVSATWKSHVGKGTSVAWPVGTGESHSSGVASAVAATNGGIGYTDTEYAITNHLKYAAVENRSLKFVLPSVASCKAASKIQVHPKSDGSLSIVNPPPTAQYLAAYPICTYSYIDVAIKSVHATALKKLIGWAILDGSGQGQSYGPALLYTPIPAPIVTFDQQQIAKLHT